MKILSLYAENIKKLQVVEIRPNGNLVEITGKNGQGKTSVLDAIWWAIAGGDNIQGAPIRKGANEAIIRLDLGDIKISRTFKNRVGAEGFTTAIVVSQANGARFPSPQAMLDGLLGELAFDPLAFTRLRPADQLDVLKRFVPDVDFAEIEAANQADYDARTIVNRDAKKARAQMASFPYPEDTPPQPIDEAALVAELQDAGARNAEIERERARRAAVAREGEAQLEAWARRLERATELRRQADTEEAAAAAHKEKAAEIHRSNALGDPVPNAIDVAPIRARIADAKVMNMAVLNRQRATELDAEAKRCEAESVAYSDAIATREAKKRAAIATAKMPIDGIGFGDGAVMLAGLPFDQASDAEQLRASVAIAAAMNPKLRVIRVRDGSLLDEDGLRLLGAFADEHDLQIWVERVDSSGNVGFVLEDGHLKEAVPEPAAVVADKPRRRRRDDEPTDGEIDRSQALLGAILGEEAE